ncbi:hypothetical protein AAG747_01765 [Rapidithrix thailandica]|uniref:Uncharacterized protein n=1 Tax=Rapidithrix thailandica TaxID=413964 RepID=A0AAW9RP84_9BACT
MKFSNTLFTRYFLIALLPIALWACKDDDDETPINNLTIDYGAEVFYANEDANETTLIKPQLRPENIEGTFTVKPEGLDIDSRTGVINVNTSEAGQRYYINFTSDDNRYLGDTSLLISGIDYADSLYNLDEGQDLALPILDEDPDLALPSSIFFDAEGGAVQEGLEIDLVTGAIKLKETLQNQESLQGTPLEDGFTKRFEIPYSYNVIQNNQPIEVKSRITLQVFYFTSRDRIPEELLQLLEEKQLYPKGGKTDGTRPPYVIVYGKYQ